MFSTPLSSGSLQRTQAAAEDPGPVALAGLDHSRHSHPGGRQPPALAVSPHAEPTHPVAAPPTAVPSSPPAAAAAAVTDAFPLVYAVTPAALYHPQSNRRVSPDHRASPAAADAHPSPASASASATAGPSGCRPLSTGNASHVAVAQASSPCTAARAASVQRSRCEHPSRRCRQNPGSHPGPDGGTAASLANNRSTNSNSVGHQPAFASAEAAAGQAAPGSISFHLKHTPLMHALTCFPVLQSRFRKSTVGKITLKMLCSMCLQVQQNILLQVKQPAHPQAPATNQFSSQQDVPVDKVVIASSANTGAPAQLPSVLQPTSVLIKTTATGWRAGL